MAIDYDSFGEMHFDVLREIGNIGIGNAATSLSTMLQKPVDIGIPSIHIWGFNEVAEKLGGPEAMMAGMMLTLEGELSGMMMFLLREEFSHMVLNALLGQSFTDFNDIDEMSLSAMQEIGNIMAGSYVNALAQLTGMKINISPPDVCIDMVGSILSVPAIHFANIGDKIIFIENDFLGDGDKSGDDLSSNILLIPEEESLKNLMQKLGVE